MTRKTRNEVWERERLVVRTTEQLAAAAVLRGITKAEWARRLGVSRANVSAQFSDRRGNLTLRTVARFAYHLGLRATVTFTPLPRTRR